MIQVATQCCESGASVCDPLPPPIAASFVINAYDEPSAADKTKIKTTIEAAFKAATVVKFEVTSVLVARRRRLLGGASYEWTVIFQLQFPAYSTMTAKTVADTLNAQTFANSVSTSVGTGMNIGAGVKKDSASATVITPSPAPAPKSEASVSTGAIIGIVIGVIAAVAIAGAAAYYSTKMVDEDADVGSKIGTKAHVDSKLDYSKSDVNSKLDPKVATGSQLDSKVASVVAPKAASAVPKDEIAGQVRQSVCFSSPFLL